jgi:alpha-beta hydrolase superfamily lysophospholipase
METIQWQYKGVHFAVARWLPPRFDHVIVLVHGIGEHGGRYQELASFFNNHGFAVLASDLYGHGQSEGKRGSSKGIDFTFDYLGEFINHAVHTLHRPVILYGHSMGGGLVAGLLLRRRPAVRAAIITSPGLLVQGMSGVKEMMLKTLYKLAPNLRISQGFDLSKMTRNREAIAAFRADVYNHDRVSIRLAYEMILNGRYCMQHAALLATETLLVHGTADAFTKIEGSRLFAAGANRRYMTFLEWQGGYHELHHEPDAASFFATLLEWLDIVLTR